jgi:beta-phosphoglucomutase-like phosphatase (HAD superfamily)
MIEAVIFDIDGTIVDSVDLHAKAWQRTFSKFGKNILLEAIRSQIGKGADQLLPVYFSKTRTRTVWRSNGNLSRRTL